MEDRKRKEKKIKIEVIFINLLHLVENISF